MLEYTLISSSTGDYHEKKSSFHALAQVVSSVEQVKSILLTQKTIFQSANHFCYAYRMKRDQRLDEYSSDSGEPLGSAGKPILNALKRANLINVAIVVSRYFGGKKLGISGLIDAYGAVAKSAIDSANLKLWLETKRLIITYLYELDGVINSILKKNQVDVIRKEFEKEVKIQLDIYVEIAEKLIKNIKNISSGIAKVSIID